MAKNKPRKPTPPPVKLQPEKYIKTKARSLPVYECFVNPNWQYDGLATVMVSRKQPSGNIVAGVYLVDVFCLGLKNTYFFFNESARYYEEELKDMVFTHQEYVPCAYELAHNIVYGAIAYAEDLGFRPHKDFAVSRYVLEEDDESVELIELEFGQDGKPCYVVGPYDNASLNISKLKAAVGDGNFTVINPGGSFGNDFDFDDDEEEDEEEFDAFEDVSGDAAEEEPDGEETGKAQ